MCARLIRVNSFFSNMGHLILLRFQVEPPSSTACTARRCSFLYYRFSAFKSFWSDGPRGTSKHEIFCAGQHNEFLRMCFQIWDAPKRSCSFSEKFFFQHKSKLKPLRSSSERKVTFEASVSCTVSMHFFAPSHSRRACRLQTLHPCIFLSPPP